jgi:hypothetical protein
LRFSSYSALSISPLAAFATGRPIRYPDNDSGEPNKSDQRDE